MARLTHNVRFPLARGLEFGPANAPTLLPEGHHVEYVDYAARPDGADETWVPIDHVWNGAGSLASVCGEVQSYHFAIARQVAQLVPNLLGWFSGIFEMLEVGGVFNLSLPDHRFTTDCARPPSTIAQAVEASIQDIARPTPRQVFEHFFDARQIEPGARWRQPVAPADLPRLHGPAALEHACRQSQQAAVSDPYPVCHCWVFTPLSFLSLIEDATRLLLFPFVFNPVFIDRARRYRIFCVAAPRPGNRSRTAPCAAARRNCASARPCRPPITASASVGRGLTTVLPENPYSTCATCLLLPAHSVSQKPSISAQPWPHPTSLVLGPLGD